MLSRYPTNKLCSDIKECYLDLQQTIWRARAHTHTHKASCKYQSLQVAGNAGGPLKDDSGCGKNSAGCSIHSYGPIIELLTVCLANLQLFCQSFNTQAVHFQSAWQDGEVTMTEVKQCRSQLFHSGNCEIVNLWRQFITFSSLCVGIAVSSICICAGRFGVREGSNLGVIVTRLGDGFSMWVTSSSVGVSSLRVAVRVICQCVQRKHKRRKTLANEESLQDTARFRNLVRHEKIQVCRQSVRDPHFPRLLFQPEPFCQHFHQYFFFFALATLCHLVDNGSICKIIRLNQWNKNWKHIYIMYIMCMCACIRDSIPAWDTNGAKRNENNGNREKGEQRKVRERWGGGG